jgi:hypothetical protein
MFARRMMIDREDIAYVALSIETAHRSYGVMAA